MPTFLQPVTLPERCFLYEVLLWVAFQRLPVAIYNTDGIEIREASDHNDYEADAPDDVIYEEECKRAGIPVDPRFLDLTKEDRSLLQNYDELEAKYGLDEAIRRIQKAHKEEEQELQRACAEWEPHYSRVIEYPASQIFVVLKSGQLRARGRLLPSVDYDQAMAALEGEERYIGGLPLKEIPSAFWTLKGIHFESSAAQNDTAHYCHISFRTADVVSIFPGEREAVSAERIGDTYILNESSIQPPRNLQRGRPSYPWDRFHLEVSAMLLQNELPAKKEAAIQHFQTWFMRELNIQPSRAAIGEKLTPYYDKFIRRSGQKT